MKRDGHQPPAQAQRFLRWILREDLAEEVLGDLDEYFVQAIKTRSPSRARFSYWLQVVNYLRPFAIRKLHRVTFINSGMFRNYLNISWRNLVKSRLFSVINVGGMAISLASFLLIGLFVLDEWKYDKHVAEVDQKFRVFNEYHNERGITSESAMVPPMIGSVLSAQFAEVDYTARLMNIQSAALFRTDSKSMTEQRGGYADPAVFDMFSLTLLEGDSRNALRKPHHLAISESVRRKYFGDSPALGQPLEVFGTPCEVAAVFADFPEHAHLRMDYFLSMEALVQEIPDRMQSWRWGQFHTYMKVKAGADINELHGKLARLVEKEAWPITKPDGFEYMPQFMAMRDIHLHAYGHQHDIAVRGNIQTVYILCGTAIFILVISILNFVNLSTARAVNRAREVGVRKVVGAFRSQLIVQFITEAVLTTLMALMMAILLVLLALPFLNTFLEKNILPLELLTLGFSGIIILSTVVVGVLAGAYPAFIISTYNPIGIMYKPSGGSGKTILRQGLVVVQFVISFLLIIGTWIVNDQHSYMRNGNQGFDKDNLVVIPLRDSLYSDLEAVKQQFSRQPGVEFVTLAYGLPGEAFAGDGITDGATKKNFSTSMLLVDEDYIPALGLELLAGRNFSDAFPADASSAFIISETMARMLGYTNPEDAIEHPLQWQRWDNPDSMKTGRVIGVTRDVHLASMRDAISPVVLQIVPEYYSSIILKLNTNDVSAALTGVENTWKSFGTHWPFEYHFLDQNFESMYKSEERLSGLFSAFSAFTIIVACLGLFGLVMYSINQRFKEIGIRKVLGAEEGSLVVMLSKMYIGLLFIAFVLAIPISYFAATAWLERFVYHISLSPQIFLKSGLVIAALALVTVVIQSLRAARSNPVSVLKSE
jgi:putative ABC transport system permease protein